jgi:capsular exopolysaccharide synthesis family protein
MTSSSLTNRPQGPLTPANETYALGPAMPSAYGGGPPISPVARFFAAIRRFKWLVLGVFVLGTAASLMVTRLMPPKYRVGVTLNLFNRGDQAGAPIQAQNLLASKQWEELLKTDAVLKPVVVERKLYIRGPYGTGLIPPPLEGPWGPDAGLFETFQWQEGIIPGRYRLEVADNGRNWTLTNERTGRTTRGTIESGVGASFGMLWAPRLDQVAGRTIEFELLTPTEVAAGLFGQLQVNMAPMGARFMRIFLEGQDPEGIALTLNTVATEFVETAAAIKKRNLTEESRVLDDQLVTARQRMEGAQAALQQFRVRAITLPTEGIPVSPGIQQFQPAVISDYLAQRQVVDSLRREQAELRNALASAQSGALAVDRFQGIGAVQRAPELQTVLTELSNAEAERRRLLVRFFPTHDSVRAVDARINELRSVTLPQYVGAVISRLEREQQGMEGRLQTGERELQQIPQRTIQEEELKRELSLADAHYQDVTRRSQLSRLQEASSLPDVDILDRAVPPVEPQSNRARFILLLGTAGSLGLALGLAFLLDMTDRRFRYSDQITSELGLSILGAVPEIRRAKGATAAAEEASQVIEAFRSIRLNMMHVVGTGPICFTVSSPMPGDGKSLVSSNLALSFAEAGFRTLLVDGDTRRGELHRMFGLDRRPGLLDHLADGVPLDQTLRSTSHPRLTVITGGSRHRNGPELLGSGRMREMVGTLREKWDVVIFDSPPFGAGIDPFLLGTLTGNLLMVVRVGETEREFTEAKLQVLDQLPVRVVGAILNDVRTSMREYRYYSYSYGYGATDEDDTGDKAGIPTPSLPVGLSQRQDADEPVET